MRLGLQFRERLTRLSRPLRDQFDDWQSTLTTWGDAQHNDDGGHTHITAESLTVTGNVVIGGGLTAGTITETAAPAPAFTRVTFGTPITPTALGATVNNYNPAGLSTANWLRVSASGAFNINGIDRSTFPDGSTLVVSNVGAVNTILLVHEAVGSTATNRILGGNNANMSLQPQDTAILISDATADRWRALQF